MTAAFLDAGMRLLLAELEPQPPTAAPSATPPVFFGALSAARVTAAATRIGPLRVTAAHLRDRWPRQDHYAEDLIRYALWAEHHNGDMVSSAPLFAARLPPGTTLEQIGERLGVMNLYPARIPVTSRVELLASALAASRPWLRELRRFNVAFYDAAWLALLLPTLRRLGLRLRDDVSTDQLARGVHSLSEGVLLRFMSFESNEAARATASGDFAFGFTALVRAWTEPLSGPFADAVPVDAVPEHGNPVAAIPPRTSLAEVLPHLMDPETGTRTTAAAQRRLVDDGITLQLLRGGLAVLAEEFGLAESATEPRFFASISTARVVAEARAAGHRATAAQMRDRWALHEHYIDDLVRWCVARSDLVPVELDPPRSETVQERIARVTREIREGWSHPDVTARFRMRLLLTTMATRSGIVDVLAEHFAVADAAALAHGEAVIEAAGWRFRTGVSRETYARTSLAIFQGELSRTVATGDDGARDGELAFTRTATALLRAAVE
ncbi:hypothetical protein SAMN06264364_10457 [Quadrisphaera granulorum]|uniref:Uncharacterized protein n=2 Tax=Quadrisphaera granulorum TaxID=317664 RepID=A0A316ABI1_9ACTN|nr:hypothetical protein BXY45_10457 [Quadrisphaera granulorum]SZE95645.1 hypothetical protein SAMN06264364_10457 [Quadrisphaera granulorum]